MATTKASFVFQNIEAALSGGSTVTAIPYVEALEKQAALLVTGRLPGGASYNGDASSVSPASANGCVMLDDIPLSAALDSYAKHGCFHVTTSGTTPVNIDLTNLATAATTYAGDTTFSKWNRLIFYNLSGVDNVAAASMTIAPGASNPANLTFTGTTPTLSLAASSRVILENAAGATVDGTHKIITITPTAGGNFALVVCGS